MTKSAIKSPFKFLDPYDREDREIFFGRTDDEKKLYQLVRKNRFVLVYGPSGSGKTSLVQCGLAKHFEPSDWIPLYIRRGNNINIALLEKLKERSDSKFDPFDLENVLVSLRSVLEEIRKKDLRNIYLIFDQFEELLILGNDREKELFKSILREINNTNFPSNCFVIILLREEYFAWLDSFEKNVPELSGNRLRVEPMRLDELKEVIIESCARFQIKLESPDETSEQIIKVVAGKRDISLPYLQVYLDQLWKNVYKKKYGEDKDFDENKVYPIEITKLDIRQFGKIQDVLKTFLKDQTNDIQKKLMELYDTIPADCLASILEGFATYEGTKLPIKYKLSGSFYKINKKSPKYLHDIKPKILKEALDMLTNSRLLRNDGLCFELAHDTLAKLINEERNQGDKKRLYDIRQKIQNNFTEFTETKEYMSYKEVKLFEESIPSLNLEKHLLDFYNKSKEIREDDELERVKSVRKTARLKLIVISSVTMFLMLAATSIYFITSADNNYGLVYVGYNMEKINNKHEALILAKYIYEEVSDTASLKGKIEQLAINQQIQEQFDIFTDTLNAKNILETGDMSISANGRFIVYNDDSTYLIEDTTFRKGFSSVHYSYFIGNSDTLLLAYRDTSRINVPGFSNQLGINLRKFVLYNCAKKMAYDSIILSPQEGTLPGREYAFVTREDGSYPNQAHYTSTGTLLIPYRGTPDYAKNFFGLNGQILVKTGTRRFSISSENALNLSPENNFFTTLETINGESTMLTYDELGNNIKPTLNDIVIGKFLDSGTLLYVTDWELKIVNVETRIDLSFPISRSVKNIFANDKYAVLTTNIDSFYVLDLKTRKKIGYHEKLIGFNLKTNIVISLSIPDKTVAKTEPEILYGRHFSGKEIGNHKCASGIESAQYNEASQSTLVYAKRKPGQGQLYLYLFNDSIKIKAAFGITANDSYGFSKDGKIIYYVRDNLLSVFKNNGSLVNLSRFSEIWKWLENPKNAKYRISLDSLERLKEKHKLKFPGESVIPGYH